MTAYATANTAAYQQQAILTATPGRLVVMLYDGALRFLFQSATAMRQGLLALADEKLRRAEAIVDELLVTLDMSQGDIAERLQAIYVFCKTRLIEARLERDPGRVDQIGRLLAGLRDAWSQIEPPAAA
jgi:flagellar secretion chaperone FliS